MKKISPLAFTTMPAAGWAKARAANNPHRDETANITPIHERFKVAPLVIYCAVRHSPHRSKSLRIRARIPEPTDRPPRPNDPKLIHRIGATAEESERLLAPAQDLASSYHSSFSWGPITERNAAHDVLSRDAAPKAAVAAVARVV